MSGEPVITEPIANLSFRLQEIAKSQGLKMTVQKFYLKNITFI